MNSSLFARVLLLALSATVQPALAQSPPVTAQSGPADGAAAAVREASGSSKQRRREGTRLVDEVGYFRTAGDRLVFHIPQTEEQFLGLENLAMERIAKAVSDRHERPEQLLWEVTGVFTEFRGNNYLMITHAVLKQDKPRRTSAAVNGR